MRSKLLKHFLSSLAIISSASAAVSVGPYGVPNAAVNNGDGFASVYYLDVSYAGQGAPTYATHAFLAGEVFEFSISGADATQGFLWVYAQSISDSTVFYPVVLSSCSAGAVGTVGRCDSGTVTDFLVRINFQAVCAGTNGSSIRGCDGTSVGVTATPILPFRLRFLSGTTTAPGSTTAATGTLLQVYPQVLAPTVTGPTGEGFFPGDGSVLIETNSITAVAETTTGSSPVFSTVWVAAEKAGTLTLGTEMGASYRQSVGYQSGQQELTGFENSTNTTQVFYQMGLGVQDSAGAVAFASPYYSNVFATDIQGFLRESNCFIATASFRDGRAPGVKLLRNFRDQVLANFELGRDFIHWYYTYGPIAADWLLENPIYRIVFLMALIPLQTFAWISLHPLFLSIPLLGFLLIAALLLRERRERRFSR